MALSFKGVLAVASLLTISQASNTTLPSCNRNNEFIQAGYYNASSSVQVNGIRINDSFPSYEMTWTKYVLNENNITRNSSTTWTTIGLSTSPIQNLSDPALPFTGCVIALDNLNLTSKALQSAQSENGTCTATLGDACTADILSAVNQNAAALSGTSLASREKYPCMDLLGNTTRFQDPTNPCYDLWTGSISTQFLQNNFSTLNPISSNPYLTCERDPNFNIGNTNATVSGFFGWSDIKNPKANNWTFYDSAIRSPLPLIVATWAKTGVVVTGNQQWHDARVMCLPPANETMPGSRTLQQADADAPNGGSARLSLGFGGVLVVGVSMLVLAL